MNCIYCGNPVGADGACTVCGAMNSTAPAEIKAPENTLLGVIGALIGALIGGASIILFSQMGYVASLSGVILSFCTLKGYELLGKQLSKKGVIICVILMVITPFAADWLNWGIMLLQEMSDYGYSLLDWMVMFLEMLADGVIPMADYLKNLGMIYLFVVLGAFGTIKNAFKSNQ